MIKKYSLVLVAFLCFVLSGFGQANYNLVTSVSDLTVGSRYIVVSAQINGTAYAIGPVSTNTNNRPQAAITIASGVINTSVATNPTDNLPFEITLGGSAGAWTLFDAVNNGYLYAGSSSKNYLKSDGSGVENWTIIFTANAAVMTSLYNLYTRNLLQYNSGSSIFSCYASGQADVYLYKLASGPTVTYNGNGSTGGSVPTDSSSPYANNDTVTVIGNTGSLTKPCSTFNNWNTAADGSGTSYSASDTFTITANTTLYAQWTSTAKTVTFDENGGDNTMASQNACTSTNLTTSSLTYTGFTFDKWNTAADGSGTDYADGALYSFSADVTLYAQWVVYVGPCLSELNFTSTPTNWVETDITYGSNEANFASNTGELTTLALTNPNSLTFDLRRTGNSSVKTLYVEVSTTTQGGTYTTLATYNHGNTNPSGTTNCSVDLSAYNSYSTVFIKFRKASSTTSPWYLKNVEVFCATPTAPYLNTSALSDFGSQCVGGTYGPNSFTITGGLLTTANVTVGALAGFTYSTTVGGTYTNSLSLTQTGGSYSQEVFVKFSPIAGGSYNGNIPLAGGGVATATNVAATGSGLATVTPAVATNTATGIGVNAATLQATSSTFGVCPPTTFKGFVYSISSVNNTPANGGTGVTTTTVTLGTQGGFTQGISGLAEGTTYSYRAYLYDGTTYTYGGIQTFTTNVQSVNNVTNTRACLVDDSGTITWTAASGATGYMVFAVASTSYGTGTPTTVLSDYGYANSNYSVATNNATPASLGKLLYKGNATSVNITGLTENTVYSFRVFTYRDGASIRGFSNGTSGGSVDENRIAQDDISNLAATPGTNQVTLNWNNPLPTTCFDELIIVANQGAVSFTPTGSNYANNNGVYSVGNTVVYATTGLASTKAITNLVNDTNYCFKIFIRRGSVWSDGVGICETPTITYCTSNGNTSYETGIRNVTLNTINNDSPQEQNDYSDFTAISTTLNIGEEYDLSVNVNTDGTFTTYTKVWIDWNRDGTFNTSGEEYDLGTAFNTTNGATSESPITIDVPSTAVIGNIRMRVSTRFSTNPTPCMTGEDGEVEDYTIIVQKSPIAEIVVEGAGNVIPSGSNTPFSFNNTLFTSATVGVDSDTKTYTIYNLGGSLLSLPGTPRVYLTGDNPGDFVVTSQPSAATIGVNGSLDFSIKFHPLGDGERTAIVTIENNDVTGNEDPYTFKIKGTGNCVGVISSTLSPIEGPENTEVTITSPDDLTNATATLNGTLLTIISTSSTELVVLIPSGAITGNLKLILDTGCSSTNIFTVIDKEIDGCDTSSSSTIPTDLFISEVTDATNGSSSFVEIFNGTSGAINLSGYKLKIYTNGHSTVTTTINLASSLASGGIYVVSIGDSSCTFNNLNTGAVNLSDDDLSGINFDFNKADAIALYKNSTSSIIDIFGVYESGSWANSLNLDDDGVDFRRKNTASPLPSTTFNLADWDIIDWTTCANSDYADIGAFDFSVGVPPTASVLNPVTSNCDLTATLSITGTEGYDGAGDSQELAYQWFYVAPGQNTWTAVPDDAIYDNVTTNQLSILNTLTLDGYQYYCQVRESGVTCFKASNAIKLNITKTTWTSSGWDNGMPDMDTVALIDYDYDTSIGGQQTSFTACSLIVNSGSTLTVKDNNFVEIINDVIVNGNTSLDFGKIVVESKGSFVQRGVASDAGTFSLNGTGKSQVNKLTALKQKWYDYTYWSSPVKNWTVNDAFPDTAANRRFYFEASNYLDSDNDDIDDNGDDWQVAAYGPTDYMTPGVGYAATSSSIGPAFPRIDSAAFIGPFNTGDIDVTISTNGLSTDNDWNFIGNPYPSAIDFNDLYSGANTNVIDGAAYVWSQSQPPLAANPGNEQLNFNQNDYAIISAGSGNIGGGAVGVPPNDFIPSGQGFFVKGINSGGTLTFNNSMRKADGTSNSMFFRTSASGQQNRLWVNLTSDNGIFNQVLVAYVDGATNGNDGFAYDAPRNLSTGVASIIYTEIDGINDKKFAIQGKDPNSLTVEEVIPLGFYTSITQATIYKLSIAQFEGDFFTNNTVYVKDNLLNLYHDLSTSDYTFTSETGEFNNRFEIVFQTDALSVGENTLSNNDLSIIELANGQVKFSIGYNLNITSVEILDLLGRTLYNLKGNSSTEVYNLSNLSQAAYIAKVKLSNGQTLIKRAVKRH